MHLFLTNVLPFLAHDHPSAVAFLTCRHHNFHSSIIPEFLSSEDRVKSFYRARQQNELKADKEKPYRNLYNLFVQTPLMQFSPSLVLCQKDCAESIVQSLLGTKYFTRSLRRCVVETPYNPYLPPAFQINNDLLRGLSKVQSLTKLVVERSEVEIEHLEIIINSFPSLETLVIYGTKLLKVTNSSKPAIRIISSPSPPAKKTLRSLRLDEVNPLLAVQLIPNFTNLRKLVLRGHLSCPALDLLPLLSSLTLLKDISLAYFTLENTESLNNLLHLSALHFIRCKDLELSFLTQENILRELTTLCVNYSDGLSTSSFASLSYVPNLQVLEASQTDFDNDCLHHLENMVHLRKLDLSYTRIVGDSRSSKTLMQNLFQLEELNLSECDIGSQGAIAGALYNAHMRLRVLNLEGCKLVDDDLNGIGKLKNTLEVLDLNDNRDLTNEALMHCKDLMKLKILKLESVGVSDLSPLKDCVNLEELDVRGCWRLTDASFKIFTEEANSFSNLRVLDLSLCYYVTKGGFEHLSKNNHLVYQLKELNVVGMSEVLSGSPTAGNNIYQLRGLRTLRLLSCFESQSDRNKLTGEAMRSLTNLEDVY